MDLRTLIPAVVLLSVGCAGHKHWTKPFTDAAHAVEKVVVPSPPLPATEISCSWVNKLQQLPDPTRGGQMQLGVVGSAYMLTVEDQFADVQGELTIMVHDDPTTPRTPHTPEVWHFSNATLKKMLVSDDRWGKSLALFLPWPADWKDVNRLVIQARYDQPDQPPIWSQQMRVTLDFSQTSGASAGGVVSSTSQQAGVPDPAQALRAMKTQNRSQPMVTTNQFVVPGTAPEQFPAGNPGASPGARTTAQPLPAVNPTGAWSTPQPPAVNTQPQAAPSEFRATIRRSAAN